MTVTEVLAIVAIVAAGLAAWAAIRTRDELRELRQAQAKPWEIIQQIHDRLLGGPMRGAVGERLLGEQLDPLGPGMVDRDFRVSGGVVEYALILPDGRRLPVDSKWPAMPQLEALVDEQDPARRQALQRKMEGEVTKKVREVAAYIEPLVTTPIAVACIPDAAYQVAGKAAARAISAGVVVVPYTTALPITLAIYALAYRLGGSGQNLRTALNEVDRIATEMDWSLQHSLFDAATRVRNVADEWQGLLGRVRRALALGRGGVDAGDDADKPVSAGPDGQTT